MYIAAVGELVVVAVAEAALAVAVAAALVAEPLGQVVHRADKGAAAAIAGIEEQVDLAAVGAQVVVAVVEAGGAGTCAGAVGAAGGDDVGARAGLVAAAAVT